MFRRPAITVVITTVYLVVYYLLFIAGANARIIAAMFAFSPILAIWMVVSILKHGKYNGPEMDKNDEWGYGDKDKDSLNTF